MATVIIYLHSDYYFGDYSLTDINNMSKEERLAWAKKSNDATVYSLDTFEQAFNLGYISDEGFIYIQ